MLIQTPDPVFNYCRVKALQEVQMCSTAGSGGLDCGVKLVESGKNCGG